MRCFVRAASVAVLVAFLSGCTIFSWGENLHGQLGDYGDSHDRYEPAPIARNPNWMAITAGWDHSCAIDTSRKLYCWGDVTYGQTGTNAMYDERVPARVGTDADWASVDAGGTHTCGIRVPGTLWCWGSGIHLSVSGSGTPLQAGTDNDWVSVATGHGFTCGIRNVDDLWCWGSNAYGQVGNGLQGGVSTFVQIMPSVAWASVSTGQDHTCAISTAGRLYCWGRGSNGRLGDGFEVNRLLPKAIGSASDWIQVDTGHGSHTCGIRSAGGSSGDLYCWGYNAFGQVGDGQTATENLTPTHVAGFASNWSEVELGWGFTCAMNPGEIVWCWGYNDNGQLADGTTTTRPLPQQAAAPAYDIAVGRAHVLMMGDLPGDD